MLALLGESLRAAVTGKASDLILCCRPSVDVRPSGAFRNRESLPPLSTLLEMNRKCTECTTRSNKHTARILVRDIPQPTHLEHDANILKDDRTMHEVYLWPFAEGVHAGVGSVMTAYNAVSPLELIV